MSTEHFEGINGRDILGGHANADGQVLFTRRRRSWAWPSRRPRSPRPGGKPGSGMIAAATALLFLLGAGLLAVSLAAQYRYVLNERHQRPAALIEGLAIDAGMLIFSLLALGLARSGKPARVERALIIACAAGSALMNFAPADPTSWRSVLSYVMPPVFLAVVADRVISVVRRAYLQSDETSAWRPAGHAAVTVLRGTGVSALYALRLLLAPRSTLAGGRRAVLLATPLPSAEPPKAIEPAANDDDVPAAAATGGAWWALPDTPVLGICITCDQPVAQIDGGTWLSSDDLAMLGAAGENDALIRRLPCLHEVTLDRGEELAEPEPRPARPREGTKTAAFLDLVRKEHGPLAAIALDRVSAICNELAPKAELHIGSARRELRAACLSAQEEAAR